ncbi:MAG: hypothetical protein ACRDLK_06325 [Gaiellaceae bacterium]
MTVSIHLARTSQRFHSAVAAVAQPRRESLQCHPKRTQGETMSVTTAILINALLDAAIVGLLAYVMRTPYRLRDAVARPAAFTAAPEATVEERLAA